MKRRFIDNETQVRTAKCPLGGLPKLQAMNLRFSP
jgi:hypothetical protein